MLKTRVLPLTLALLLAVAGRACAAQFGSAEDAAVEISPELEASLNRGLSYLADTQQDDGSWSGPYGKNVGVVSLSLMSFMALGNLPGEGPHGDVVAKGVNWILEQSQPNGLIQYTRQDKQAAAMYGHALATLMLSEVWGQTRRNDVGQVLRKAADLIVRVQGPRGGWGYQSVPKDGDTSVCVMQMFALKSAEEAGIYVPRQTIAKAVELVKTSRYDKDERGFGYNDRRFNPGHAGSSAAGTCIMYIVGEENPAYTLETLNRLIEDMEQGRLKVGHRYYFYYYTAVASYAAGEEPFRRCMKMLEPILIKSQGRNGSWNHSAHDTAFAVLAGALPFRYLPIYQR